MLKVGIRKKTKESIAGWVFISPMIVGMLLFLTFPLIFSIVISFTNYTIGMDIFGGDYQFIGFENYRNALYDVFFMQGMINILITCAGIPIGLVISLIITNLLVSNPKFAIIFKAIYYVPTICGMVAITFIWQWIYAPMYGLINQVLASINIPTVAFVGSKQFFIPSMIVMGIWSGMGTMILLLFASLKAISKQLYEAASIDGANFFQKFIHITIPGLSPTIFYILVTGISGTLQEFTKFQIMRGGVVSDWSVTPAWWIYNYTIDSAYGFQLGYASSLGIILGVFILIISAIQFVISRMWVSYD